MPPPPPPPPGAPPPPAPPALPKLGGAAGGLERKDLLKDIQSGARLKPTKTNDRSAPVVGSGKSATAATGPSSNDRSGGGGGNGDSRTDAQSSQFTGPLPGIGGLFAGGMPTLKKTKGGINTGRAPDPESPKKSAANGSSSSNNINNKFLNSSTSSLNSSPSLSPSPSPVSTSTPVHSKPDVQRGNLQSPAIGHASSNLTNAIPSKPPPPATKPNYTRPQNGGPVHPSNKPPPPPIGGGAKTNLGRNQTIGHGPQGRPQIPNYEKRRSRDDSSIGNGHMGGANGPPPPPPVRTVSQNQITNSSRVPTRAPPPPPPSHKRPSQPPPPPPGQASHQAPMQPPTKALPPPPPSVLQAGGDPPTPPTRRESIYRTGQTNNNTTAANGSGFSAESFESKFASRFKTLQFLPPPEPFSGCQKTYPSKQTLPVRQGSQIKRTPAPPPPPGGIPPPPVSHAPYPPGGGVGKSSMFERPPLPSARQMSVTTTTGIL